MSSKGFKVAEGSIPESNLKSLISSTPAFKYFVASTWESTNIGASGLGPCLPPSIHLSYAILCWFDFLNRSSNIWFLVTREASLLVPTKIVDIASSVFPRSFSIVSFLFISNFFPSTFIFKGLLEISDKLSLIGGASPISLIFLGFNLDAFSAKDFATKNPGTLKYGSDALFNLNPFSNFADDITSLTNFSAVSVFKSIFLALAICLNWLAVSLIIWLAGLYFFKKFTLSFLNTSYPESNQVVTLSPNVSLNVLRALSSSLLPIDENKFPQ